MGNRAQKIRETLAARLAAFPNNGLSHKGHKMHKPGSQNPKKNGKA